MDSMYRKSCGGITRHTPTGHRLSTSPKMLTPVGPTCPALFLLSCDLVSRSFLSLCPMLPEQLEAHRQTTKPAQRTYPPLRMATMTSRRLLPPKKKRRTFTGTTAATHPGPRSDAPPATPPPHVHSNAKSQDHTRSFSKPLSPVIDENPQLYSDIDKFGTAAKFKSSNKRTFALSAQPSTRS